MPTPSEHTRLQLELYPNMRAKAAWPHLDGLRVRHRGQYAYVWRANSPAAGASS